MHFRVVFTGDAEHVDDPAQRFGALLRPVGDQYGHFHAVGCLLAADLGQFVGPFHVDAHVVGHVLALDDSPHLLPPHDQDADVRTGAAADDLGHFAFQAAALRPGDQAPFRDGDLHEVAVEREMQLAHRHEDVFGLAFHLHEAESVARQRNRPLELLHGFGATLRLPHRLLFAPGQPLRPLEGTFPHRRSSFLGIFPFFTPFSIRYCHIFLTFARLQR